MTITVFENGILRDATTEDTADMAAARAARAIERETETKTQYQRNRAAEYPPITDYLDGVVKNDQTQIQTYIDACLAVKAKYPKPE
jgi:hypothetical protein